MRRGAHRRPRIAELLAQATEHAPVTVQGWIATSRFSKNVSFLHLRDGSTPRTVQVVLPELPDNDTKLRLSFGASVEVSGRWVASQGGKQAWEILADDVRVVGDCDPSPGKYPIQKKRMSFEQLRTAAHMRPRTNTFQSVFRVRNALSWQINKFFQERNFLWIHTPIIACSDAEGAGEIFHISPNDEGEHFFGQPAFMTVSGQLEVECFAEAFCDVYTFGPTFRAENSNTTRHANEFWMIEPEMAFANLDDVVALAEDFVRTVALATFDQLPEDFAFFDQRIEKGNSAAIRELLDKPFSRVTYTEAQEILAGAKRNWDYPIGWGTAMQAEHERFLAEEHFKGPVFVTDYPIEQKAFYMRVNDDGKTVAATDLLVPRLGEIIGGSQREERLHVLQDQLQKRGIDEAPMWWYTDLRRYGSTPHGGFGLGFERMLMWLTGMKNIRDTIPFPRTPGSADF